MKYNIVWRILGNFFCFILSIIFIAVAIIVPFYYSITALTTPKTVAEIVQNVDYKTVIEKSPNIKSALQTYGIDSTAADDFMKSDKAGELIEVYTDEVTEILLDIPDNRMFNVELIKELVDENLDDFVVLAEKNTNLNLSEKSIKANVDTFIKNNEPQIKEAIPAIEQTRTVVKTIKASTVIENTLTLNFAIILILSTISVLLIICLIKRTKGFLWIGLDFLIISIVLALIVVFSRSSIISIAALQFSRFESEIIESAISICTEKVIIALVGTAIFAVLFLMFFVVIVLVKRKYRKIAANCT